MSPSATERVGFAIALSLDSYKLYLSLDMFVCVLSFLSLFSYLLEEKVLEVMAVTQTTVHI